MKLDDQALSLTREKFERGLGTLGVEVGEVVEEPGRSIGLGAGEEMSTSLIRERLDGAEGGALRLSLGELLGEGGMGQVREGVQLVLGREVAVKSLRPDRRSAGAERALLREAWVTGSLEHPNIVPVHDIATDEEGEALIILKRIEGRSLVELLENPSAIRATSIRRDPFEWQLSILERVADALRFAHSRGIVHRDLKPENVMVGEFGEVYLLDWGIAVSFEPEAVHGGPRSPNADLPVGTPAYMAPEMLGGRGTEIGPWTDVYLMGGLLYRMLTGRPPHVGNTLQQLIASIVISEFELPRGHSPELAEIIQRAMSAEIADRYQDVESFIAALVAHSEHRSSERIATRAWRQLEALVVLLKKSRSMRLTLSGEGSDLQDRAVRLFTEIRFALRQALDIWPDNQRASESLRRTLTLMIEFELRRGNPRAAAAALREMESPPEELAAEVRAAVDEQRDEKREIQRIRQERDVAAGRRSRVAVVMLYGLFWSVAPVLPRWLSPDLPARALHLAAVAASVGCLALLLVLSYLRRDLIRQTDINRRVSLVLAVLFVGQVGIHTAGYLSGTSFLDALQHYFTAFVVLAGAIAITAERMLLLLMGIYAIGGLVAAGTSIGNDLVLFACNLAMILNFAILWTFRDTGDDRSLTHWLWGKKEE